MLSLEHFNLADWHDTRELQFIPEHFTVVPLVQLIDKQKIQQWIIENTIGRYAFDVKRNPVVNDDLWVSNSFGYSDYNLGGLFQTVNLVGFENPSDATMFVLQYQSKNNFDYFF